MRLAISLRVGAAPVNATWLHLYGRRVAVCGIGFTMSLFIGALALDTDSARQAIKIGVMSGSVASAIAGMAGVAVCSA